MSAPIRASNNVPYKPYVDSEQNTKRTKDVRFVFCSRAYVSACSEHVIDFICVGASRCKRRNGRLAPNIGAVVGGKAQQLEGDI